MTGSGGGGIDWGSIDWGSVDWGMGVGGGGGLGGRLLVGVGDAGGVVSLSDGVGLHALVARRARRLAGRNSDRNGAGNWWGKRRAAEVIDDRGDGSDSRWAAAGSDDRWGSRLDDFVSGVGLGDGGLGEVGGVDDGVLVVADRGGARHKSVGDSSVGFSDGLVAARRIVDGRRSGLVAASLARGDGDGGGGQGGLDFGAMRIGYWADCLGGVGGGIRGSGGGNTGRIWRESVSGPFRWVGCNNPDQSSESD